MSLFEGHRSNNTLSRRLQPVTSQLGSLIATSNTRVITDKVVDSCINGYLSRIDGYTPLLPIDRTNCVDFFEKSIRQNIVITLWQFEKVVGFLIATKGFSALSSVNFLQQTFYNSDFEGSLAVKAVWVTHRLLIDIAKWRGCDYVVSMCSSADTTFSFNRILTKDGWTSQGHTSVFKIKE